MKDGIRAGLGLFLLFPLLLRAEIKEAHAIVRATHGVCEFKVGDQAWKTLKVNMTLAPGVTLRTGKDSGIDLSVNGVSSMVRLVPETVLRIVTMNFSKDPLAEVHETFLSLNSGSILGNVKKISAGSRYEIQTPCGVAAIRGTDFQITVPNATNGAGTIFTCVTGQLVVDKTTFGNQVLRILRAGESWAPCGDDDATGDEPAETNAPPPRLTEAETPNVRALAQSYNDFGFRLFAAATKEQRNKNVSISPLGAALTLAMLEHGANQATSDEIKRALGTKDLGETASNERTRLLLDQFAGDSGERLEIANSLWVNKSLPVAPAFINEMGQIFQAEAANLDFADPATATRIDGWVSQRTLGKITNVVKQLDPQDPLVATSAVYFKGIWKEKFQKALTEEEPFQPAAGLKFAHPRMKQSGWFAYLETRQFQLAALPYYDGQVTAYVLLPKAKLARFLSKLTAAHWKEWVARMEQKDGNLELPRFAMEHEYDLKPLLEGLGMRRAFSERDSFPRVAANCHLSKADQATYVEVDEKGSKSPAINKIEVTQIVVRDPFEMIVDRPFLFVIEENTTGAILFMGAINDPRG